MLVNNIDFARQEGSAADRCDHGKIVDYPMAVLVLQNIVSCLKELAVQGQPVKLEGFNPPSVLPLQGGATSLTAPRPLACVLGGGCAESIKLDSL